MRHTRNRQLVNSTKDRNFMKCRNYEIEFMKGMKNDLDPTFIWRRKFLVDGRNTVFFQKNGSLRVVKVKSE